MKFEKPPLPLPGVPQPVTRNRAQRRAAGKQPPSAFVQAFNVGLKAQQDGDLAAAEAAYRQAIQMNPNDAMLLNNFGVVLYNIGRVEEAITVHQKAVSLDPRLAMAYNNLGVELNALERHPEAIAAFSKAIELQPVNPKAINNMGDSLTKLGRFEEGLAALKRSIAMEPTYAEAHSNLGMALWGLGRLGEALASFRHALTHQPDHASVRKNLGLVLLLNGDLAEGWREYEWRWIADKIPIRSEKPRWQAQDLGDKKLFVWSEQGIGDEILHLSMLDDLVQRGMKVMWETDERLVPLFQRSYPMVEVVPRAYPPLPVTMGDDIVAHSPSASLGLFLRFHLSQFPANRRSYLKPDAARASAFRERLRLAPGEKLVGISWVSKNLTIGANKTIPLAQWAEVLRIPGARFVDLQYGDTSPERAELKQRFGIHLEHFDDLDLKSDMDGMSALTSCCDVVVTVSNTTAHVAGALGVPVWVLLPAKLGKFWYWGYDSDASLWYPSARIIRQTTVDDWSATLGVAAARLRDFVAAR